MSDIKSVIQLLCQHLNILLKVNLKPENFRLAKFNNNDHETIRELWTTLENLLLALQPRIPQNEGYNTQIWVKLQMACKGYNSLEFYGLPPDNSRGSRELLLTLMWIVAKENALAHLTQEFVCQSPLSQEYADTSQQQVLTKGSNTNTCCLPSDVKDSLGLDDQINYCILLANQIKNNINQIHDFEEEKIKYTHQVHQATAGASGLPHLSVFETQLVRDPELLAKLMPDLSKLNELLNIHTKWLKKKSAFWEWMETVVELKEKEGNASGYQQLCDDSALANFAQAVHKCTKGLNSTESKGHRPIRFPRFFISSCLAKSSRNLVRNASSSDLLACMNINENGVAMQASDCIAHIDTELQEVEKVKHDKMKELNVILQSLTQKLGLVAITDLQRVEVESEDCSK